MSVYVSNITVSYQRRPAVHHVSGRFECGVATAIVGPNGAGKSTLLKAIAGIFYQYIRAEDSASRWGGEEFLILTPSRPLAEGLVLAETLREAVEKTTIYDGDITINTTITLGVVAYSPGKTFDSLIKEADFYLYAGKKLQRNCVMSSAGSG